MRLDAIKLRNNAKAAGRQTLVSLTAIVAALAIGMVIIALMDVEPVKAMKQLFTGAFGTKNAIAETLAKMSPLLFTGMSYALASRCGLTNIGMEGQLYVGAMAASVAGIYVQGLPAWLHLPLCLVAGFIGGAVWGGIAGVLKVKFGASELITTVMLNTIAINLVIYMVNGPITEPPGADAQSSPLLPTALLPNILRATRAHLGILIALLFVLLFYVFLWKSKKGYELRVAGLNPHAAAYSGINTRRNMVLVMLLAGGLAGLAGANEVLGIQGRLYAKVSRGMGLTASPWRSSGQTRPWARCSARSSSARCAPGAI